MSNNLLNHVIRQLVFTSLYSTDVITVFSMLFDLLAGGTEAKLTAA